MFLMTLQSQQRSVMQVLTKNKYPVLLKLQGYSVERMKVEFQDEANHVSISSLSPAQCPICKQRFRFTMPGHAISSTLQYWVVPYPASERRQVNCPRCGIRTEEQSIADGKKRHSGIWNVVFLVIRSSTASRLPSCWDILSVQSTESIRPD